MKKIDKGIPIIKNVNEIVETMKLLEVGDSFQLDNREERSKAESYRQNALLGDKKFSIRKYAPYYRCWRIK